MVKAIGLCGLDGSMIQARKLESGADLGYVGEIVRINTKIITDATNNGYVPIIATIAGGVNGEVYNINADIAAARIAAELGAKS